MLLHFRFMYTYLLFHYAQIIFLKSLILWMYKHFISTCIWRTKLICTYIYSFNTIKSLLIDVHMVHIIWHFAVNCKNVYSLNCKCMSIHQALSECLTPSPRGQWPLCLRSSNLPRPARTSPQCRDTSTSPTTMCLPLSRYRSWMILFQRWMRSLLWLWLG